MVGEVYSWRYQHQSESSQRSELYFKIIEDHRVRWTRPYINHHRHKKKPAAVPKVDRKELCKEGEKKEREDFSACCVQHKSLRVDSVGQLGEVARAVMIYVS